MSDLLYDILATPQDRREEELKNEIERLQRAIIEEYIPINSYEAMLDRNKKIYRNVIDTKDADIERLREALKAAKDLAEYWINRECTLNYSEQDYTAWLALGHQSRSMEKIRAALAGEEGKR